MENGLKIDKSHLHNWTLSHSPLLSHLYYVVD